MNEKRGAFGFFLREGGAYVHLDARRDGVDVPAHLQDEPHAVIQYSTSLLSQLPVLDLQADDRAITATLDFDGKFHKTVVPWDAVYAITNADSLGIMWEDDIPPDIEFTVRKPDFDDDAPTQPTLRLVN